MHHAIESGFRRHFELLLKDGNLFVLEPLVFLDRAAVPAR